MLLQETMLHSEQCRVPPMVTPPNIFHGCLLSHLLSDELLCESQLPGQLMPCTHKTDVGQLLIPLLCALPAVFRSALDTWAIGQLFPILPIHRLDEEPTVAATLADLTCGARP